MLFFQSKDTRAFRHNLSRWRQDQGETVLKYNHPLTSKSIVVDAGGYIGDWSSHIYAMYSSTIIIYEPVKSFHSHLNNKFRFNKKIKVFHKGLSGEKAKTKINLSQDGSSLFAKKSDQFEMIQLVDATKEFEKSFSLIDLLKINIEGSEYDLLENLIESGYVKKINRILVQFHNFVPDANTRRHNIHESLKKTHKSIFCYDYVWELWEKL